MSRNAETNIQNSIIIAIGGRADAMAWRNQSGCFRAMDNPDRIIQVGQLGSPDVLSVVAVTITPEMVGQTIGVAVGIEVKTDKGKQSEQQKKWQRAFEKKGGIYLLARSQEQAESAVQGLSSIICNRSCEVDS